MSANIKLPCPYCAALGHRGARALWLHRGKGVFKCFRCDERGNAAKLRRDHGMDVDRYLIAGWQDGDDVPGPKYSGKLPPEYTRLTSAGAAESLTLDAHWRYLTVTRGLHPADVEEWRIGACLSGLYAGRVVIPTDDGFVARSIVPGAASKYLAPPGYPPASMFNRSALLLFETPVIVEGAFDALNLWPSAVALHGKTPKDPQVHFIGQHCRGRRAPQELREREPARVLPRRHGEDDGVAAP